MYTSLCLLALAIPVTPAVTTPERPTWMNDYDQARKEARQANKPLAVVLAPGSKGWDQLSKAGKLGKNVQKLLDSSYVCVYVDTNRDQRLASSFEIGDGPGLVLSDRTGNLQAFRHEGDLSDEDLERQLRKFSDPERMVRATETASNESIRYYQPPAYSAPFQPGYFPAGPAPVRGGGRSC